MGAVFNELHACRAEGVCCVFCIFCGMHVCVLLGGSLYLDLHKLQIWRRLMLKIFLLFGSVWMFLCFLRANKIMRVGFPKELLVAISNFCIIFKG